MTTFEMLEALLKDAVSVRIESGDFLASVQVVPANKYLSDTYIVHRKSSDHDALSEVIEKAWRLER